MHTSLSCFQPLGKLGKGSFSTVYKVRHHLSGKCYALKKIAIQSLKQKEQQGALNEIRILASLQSPYLVGYEGAFLDKGQLCILLELANDGDLQQKIKRAKQSASVIEEKQIWTFCAHCLSAIAYLHSNSILHRDIKSANIFIHEGTYKLGDLNVSKVSQSLARTQIGTPFYASPQVWQDQPYGPPSDMWSFGCVLYELCSLHPPFQANSAPELLNKIRVGTYDPILSSYSSDLARLVRGCLNNCPERRPSAQKILTSRVFREKCVLFGIQCSYSAKIQNQNPSMVKSDFRLLDTILMPSHIEQLTSRLPQPKSRALFKPKIPSPQKHDAIIENSPYYSAAVEQYSSKKTIQKHQDDKIMVTPKLLCIKRPLSGLFSKRKPEYDTNVNQAQYNYKGRLNSHQRSLVVQNQSSQLPQKRPISVEAKQLPKKHEPLSQQAQPSQPKTSHYQSSASPSLRIRPLSAHRYINPMRANIFRPVTDRYIAPTTVSAVSLSLRKLRPINSPLGSIPRYQSSSAHQVGKTLDRQLIKNYPRFVPYNQNCSYQIKSQQLLLSPIRAAEQFNKHKKTQVNSQRELPNGSEYPSVNPRNYLNPQAKVLYTLYKPNICKHRYVVAMGKQGRKIMLKAASQIQQNLGLNPYQLKKPMPITPTQ